MKELFLILFLGTALHSAAQDSVTVWVDSCDAFWARQEAEFLAEATSPLSAEDRAAFEHFERFPYDSRFHVLASFTPAKDPEVFLMKTHTERLPKYRPYGTLAFSIDGRPFTLTVYQSLDLMAKPGLENYLFLPFTDLTSGEECYGGGRYMDLQGPLSGTVVVDFNLAYNPYCAYSEGYSCPIPPQENSLDLEVRAGVKKFHD